MDRPRNAPKTAAAYHQHACLTLACLPQVQGTPQVPTADAPGHAARVRDRHNGGRGARGGGLRHGAGGCGADSSSACVMGNSVPTWVTNYAPSLPSMAIAEAVSRIAVWRNDNIASARSHLRHAGASLVLARQEASFRHRTKRSRLSAPF